MKKKKIRDTPEIVIPKGYGIDDLLDFDDEGYENGEPAALEEVKVTFEREWNEKQRVWKINNGFIEDGKYANIERKSIQIFSATIETRIQEHML